MFLSFRSCIRFPISSVVVTVAISVDFWLPIKPQFLQVVHVRTSPVGSVRVNKVLFRVSVMWSIPSARPSLLRKRLKSWGLVNVPDSLIIIRAKLS
jgi:hypothetical protein